VGGTGASVAPQFREKEDLEALEAYCLVMIVDGGSVGDSLSFENRMTQTV